MYYNYTEANIPHSPIRRSLHGQLGYD